MPYITEFSGIMILVISGDGVVVNTTPNKSGMKGASSIQITSAWGLAVMLPTSIFSAASGAYFNPVLTIVLTAGGSMAQGLAPGYIVAQFAGVFVGIVIVHLLFKDQCGTTESAVTKLGTLCTGPSVPNMGHNILGETMGIFILAFTIKDTGQVIDIAPGIDKLLIFGIIVSTGMSLDGLTGYATNPTRGLGLHLAHAALSIKGRGDSNWGYASVVIIGPVVGTIAVVLPYQATPWV